MSPLVRRVISQSLASRAVEDLSQEEVAKVIEELRLRSKEPEFSQTYGTKASLMLIELGQKDVLDDYLKTHYYPYRRESVIFGSGLRDLHQPYIITYIANDLLINEPIQPIRLDKEGSYPRASVMAGSIIRKIIINGSAFSPEVKEWAKSLINEGSEADREALRAFWLKNGASFAAGNFLAVTPPERAEIRANGDNRAVASTVILPAVARSVAKRVGTVAESQATSGQPAASAISKSAVGTTSAATIVSLWPWLVLAGGSLGGWFWWRSRSG